MGRVSKTVATITVLGMIVFAACQGGGDDIEHNPTVSKGGPTTPGSGSSSGGSSGNGGDMQDAGPTDDGGIRDAAGDASFDRDACRQAFVAEAVQGKIWYKLDCDNSLTGDRNQCQSASPAEEVILNLRDDDRSSYWLNVLSYSAWGNKSTMSGEFCRGPSLRDQQVSWRLVGCNKIELQTGCGTTETATLDGDELRFDRGDEGTLTMWSRPLTAFQGRQSSPLSPNGQCASRQASDDPACQGQ